MKAAAYANLIAAESASVFIPPVGCLLRVRFVSAPHGLPPELDAEVVGISIGPSLRVTLRVRAGGSDPSAHTQDADILPEEIVRILDVPIGLENPYYWWRRPRDRG
jgi:hypothetical protein